jgi:hypothetical protein
VISIPSVRNRAKGDDGVTLAEPLARQSQGQPMNMRAAF